ncbi:MAG TPA: NCS2 family permease [Rhodanobacteraceae bacterium]|nr:NCS2 family permease [Rhodanobacteraceae bacterium]
MEDSTGKAAAAASGSGMRQGAVARYFRLAEEGSDWRREIVGGVTTFLAMAYILFVNPQILSAAGMDKAALFSATALASIVGCVLMGVLARYPVAVAPSMGLNAFFAYTVVLGMGVRWQMALVGVLLSGVVFVLITLLKLREVILDAIPADLKHAAACGIGLFIAFIGFENAGIVVANQATLVALGDLGHAGTLLTVFGLVVSIGLMLRRVPGAIFFGMAATACLGVATGVIAPPAGIVDQVPSVAPLFGVAIREIVADPAGVFNVNMLVIVLTFVFVEFFDTAGTLIAIASKVGLLKDNKLVRSERALLADSSSIVAAAVIGVSPTTAYIESAAGVASGARTGLSTLVVAALFALALFFSPLLAVVTPNVTAPALILVGVLMVSALAEIQWSRLEIAVPAFLTLVTMPLTYSIANGIALGLVAYPLTLVAAGRWRDVHPMMYGLLIVCLLYFGCLA